jgi:hypothetical protein
VGVLSALGGLAVLSTFWLTGLVKLANAIFHRWWRLLGIRLILLVMSVPLVVIGVISGDYIHLFMMYPYYRHVIDHSPNGPIRFAWGDSAVSALDGLQLRILIYDRTGETRQKINIETQNSEGIFQETDHFLGNFFIEHIYTH